jgi:hypothetical protein
MMTLPHTNSLQRVEGRHTSTFSISFSVFEMFLLPRNHLYNAFYATVKSLEKELN